MIYLLQVSVCTAIYYLLYHFFFQDKSNHRFNRFYLLGALSLSLVVPLLQIPVFPEYLERAVLIPAEGSVSRQAKEGLSFLTWKNLLLLMYSLGVFVHLVIMLRRLSSLASIIQSSEKAYVNGITRVYTDSGLPLSSFLSYLIIPKEREAAISAYELNHEESHIRQKHTWDLLFVELLKVLFWFNPLMLFYKKRLVEIHEYLADQSTATQLGQSAYEAFLIQQVSKAQQAHLIHNFYSLFKKRINMMNSDVKTKSWQYFLLLPILLGSLSLFSFKSYPVYQSDNSSLMSHDTFPALPANLIGKSIDTVITFDPTTKTETIHYVESGTLNPSSQTIIDTVLVYDPATGKETIEIVRLPPQSSLPENIKRNTGIDTVIVFDAATYKETVIIYNHDTGQVDTIQ